MLKKIIKLLLVITNTKLVLCGPSCSRMCGIYINSDSDTHLITKDTRHIEGTYMPIVSQELFATNSNPNTGPSDLKSITPSSEAKRGMTQEELDNLFRDAHPDASYFINDKRYYQKDQNDASKTTQEVGKSNKLNDKNNQVPEKL